MTRGLRVAMAVVAVGVAMAVVARRAAPPREIHWRSADTGAAVLPPPPLGAPGAASPAAAPRLLRVDSSGCAPVQEPDVAATLSLDSAARAGGIPLDMLVRGLKLPADVRASMSLRDLMRKYGFTLQDVRRVVDDYLKHCE